MFRKTVPSLSTKIWLELIVEPTRLCLFSWVEVDQESYELYAPLVSDGTSPLPEPIARSLIFREEVRPHTMPSDASGVYYKSFPCVRLFGPYVTGEELDASLTGRFFKAQGYSLLDLNDPSIGAWELEDGAVFTIGVDYDGYPRPCFNAVSYESNTKMHPMRAARQLGAPVSLMVYMPFAGTSLTECSMTFKYNVALGYKSNVAFENTQEWDYLPHFEQAMPKLEIVSGGGSIVANEQQTVVIKMVDASGAKINKNTTIYLENTAGYLPKYRVELNNGEGSFKIRAMDLSTGDTFKVKAGFRSYTGMLDINFEVV